MKKLLTDDLYPFVLGIALGAIMVFTFLYVMI